MEGKMKTGRGELNTHGAYQPIGVWKAPEKGGGELNKQGAIPVKTIGGVTEKVAPSIVLTIRRKSGKVSDKNRNLGLFQLG